MAHNNSSLIRHQRPSEQVDSLIREGGGLNYDNRMAKAVRAGSVFPLNSVRLGDSHSLSLASYSIFIKKKKNCLAQNVWFPFLKNGKSEKYQFFIYQTHRKNEFKKEAKNALC